MSKFARAPSQFDRREDYAVLTPDKIYPILESDGLSFIIPDDSGNPHQLFWKPGWKMLDSNVESIEKLEDPSVHNVFFTVVDLGNGPFVAFFDSEVAVQAMGKYALSWEEAGGALIDVPKEIISKDFVIDFNGAKTLVESCN